MKLSNLIELIFLILVIFMVKLFWGDEGAMGVFMGWVIGQLQIINNKL